MNGFDEFELENNYIKLQTKFTGNKLLFDELLDDNNIRYTSNENSMQYYSDNII